MTAAKVAQLAADLLAAGVGFSVATNPDVAGDWIVSADPNGTVDAKQITALETKYGVTSPITSNVIFV